jgi:hypothetical protein
MLFFFFLNYFLFADAWFFFPKEINYLNSTLTFTDSTATPFQLFNWSAAGMFGVGPFLGDNTRLEFERLDEGSMIAHLRWNATYKYVVDHPVSEIFDFYWNLGTSESRDGIVLRSCYRSCFLIDLCIQYSRGTTIYSSMTCNSSNIKRMSDDEKIICGFDHPRSPNTPKFTTVFSHIFQKDTPFDMKVTGPHYPDGMMNNVLFTVPVKVNDGFTNEEIHIDVPDYCGWDDKK